MTPDPAKVRKEAEKIRNQRLQEADRVAKRAATARKKRIQKLREGMFDTYINHLDATIEICSKRGDLSYRERLGRFENTNEERYEALAPVWDKVVKHYTDAGYKAYIDVMHHTTPPFQYGSDDYGGYPDGSTYSIVLDWAT